MLGSLRWRGLEARDRRERPVAARLLSLEEALEYLRARDRFRDAVFSLRRDRKQRLDQATTHDFYVIDCVDWVNVIPLTPDDEIVFIQLHRHGRMKRASRSLAA